MAEFEIDLLSPSQVIEPENADEVCEVLASANSRELAVIPWGGGTKQHLGNPPSRYDVALSPRNLNRLIDYQPADMTVTLEAGVTLAELQRILAEKGQWLPLEPPFAERATIGGIIAANSAGPSRLGYGTVRDMLIGIGVVQSDGRRTNFGGRVVKNVAGYDLCKLYTGSFGTLGVIVQATFKVRPLPEERKSLRAMAPGRENLDWVEEVLLRILDSDLSPVSLELGDSTVSVGDDLCVVPSFGRTRRSAPTKDFLELGFDGQREDVEWQLSEARSCLSACGVGVILESNGADNASTTPYAPITIRLNVLSSEVANFCQLAKRVASEQDLDCSIVAQVGNGVIHLHLSGQNEEKTVGSFIKTLREAAEKLGGAGVLERAPRQLKEKLGVWGSPRAEWELMKAIKDKLDPKHVLNPGRFVNGI